LNKLGLKEGCVVGAGSVVTKTMPPYSICFGNPCKPIRLRFTKQELSIHLDKVESSYSVEQILNLFENR
jgi:serine acetyltransferase